jgi:hypothetical protein
MDVDTMEIKSETEKEIQQIKEKIYWAINFLKKTDLNIIYRTKTFTTRKDYGLKAMQAEIKIILIKFVDLLLIREGDDLAVVYERNGSFYNAKGHRINYNKTTN